MMCILKNKWLFEASFIDAIRHLFHKEVYIFQMDTKEQLFTILHLHLDWNCNIVVDHTWTTLLTSIFVIDLLGMGINIWKQETFFQKMNVTTI
jgi:hypothetical protein